ncbi:protein FAM188B [Sinocyclocheilus rhinocerous]|uniref:protein FAM188B n=1 Tax=Sinocyclocheilus rhinocerous TaxID=307959 RepID=UPI0007B95794|nr:PREDICTED: protein FAM188B-like [Sinocyclocheilus rhinocerous]
MMGKDVEEVSASLVREYLSRKGLKKTIACMDEELPRTNSSINNRSDLRRILHLEGLYKKNKAEEHPLKSMLEIIVKDRMSEGGKPKGCRHGDNQAHPLEQTISSSSMDMTGNVKREEDCMENLLGDSPRLSESSVSQVIVPSQTPSEITHKSFAVHPESERLGNASHPFSNFTDDIENEESLCDVSRTTIPMLSLDKTPMDQMTATALKEIIFGSPMACFTEEWKQQNFTFSDTPGLKYGIVQKKGGPCGVLAAVQACAIQKLLFEESSNDSLDERLEVSNILRTKCLSRALADILWRAGNMKRATVAINTGRSLFTPIGRYKSDGILEMITYVTMETLDDLTSVLEQHIRQFESGPFGCILLTVSAILSRTIATIQSDMDVPTSTLIGAHGYCTQELVNLLLCGQAVSNVFDDEMKLDSGNGNFTLLKGIKAHCNIGLLSLFEHYDICKVGSHLKTPKFPIWVVCSESHFSVLFCPSEDLATDHCREEEFDLYYYDGLANQQEPIRLTVYLHCAAGAAQNDNADSDLIPPLELCIRTKWQNAVVSWNNTDPIL